MPNGLGRFGNFGAVIPGGVDVVKAALERRGMGGQVPQLSQVGGGATPPPPRIGTPPLPQTPQMRPATQAPTAGQGAGESELIVRALTQRLASLSKQQEGGLV